MYYETAYFIYWYNQQAKEELLLFKKYILFFSQDGLSVVSGRFPFFIVRFTNESYDVG